MFLLLFFVLLNVFIKVSEVILLANVVSVLMQNGHCYTPNCTKMLTEEMLHI